MYNTWHIRQQLPFGGSGEDNLFILDFPNSARDVRTYVAFRKPVQERAISPRCRSRCSLRFLVTRKEVWIQYKLKIWKFLEEYLMRNSRKTEKYQNVNNSIFIIIQDFFLIFINWLVFIQFLASIWFTKLYKVAQRKCRAPLYGLLGRFWKKLSDASILISRRTSLISDNIQNIASYFSFLNKNTLVLFNCSPQEIVIK